VSPHVATGAVIVDAINGIYDRAVNEAEQLVGEMEAQDLQSLAHELEEPQDLLDVDDEAPSSGW
jgi:general secretion pathway protein E